MDGPRAPSSEEFSEVIQFFSKHLRQDKTWSIADEYPLVLNSTNLNNIRVIKNENEFLSGAVVKTSFMKSPAGLFKVAGIGSVVTDPRFRNQGLSQAILKDSLETAQAQACDVAVLWTNLHDFYRKLEFELAGFEISLRIEEPLNLESNLKFLDSTRVAPEAILKLYAQHTCGSLRSVEDIRKSLAIPSSRVFSAWDQQGRMVAYAVEGKGADLTHHIHEWGGAVSHLLPLFDFARKTIGSPITVLSPGHSRNLIRQLEAKSVVPVAGVLGMIKILNPDLLFSKIRRYARSQGFDQLVLEQKQNETYFGWQSAVFKTDRLSDVVKLIFGPTKAKDLYPFESEVNAVLESLFPIPFWIWGWDSV